MDPSVYAAESLRKQTSSIIDALFAPKIDRIKAWAKERELQGRLDESNVVAAFGGYLPRLLRRVSGVPTIVFPQQTLPLPDIYEPLLLEEKHSGKWVDVDEIRQDGARTYIIDGAGMGKSMFARHLMLTELIREDRIPLLLELRRIRPEDGLIEALAHELDDLDKTFDRDTLLRLLSIGRFLIVLDGLDELPAARRHEISRDVEELAIKAENCALILTSRPEIPLPDMPRSRGLALKPLSQAQAISLLRRYDRFANISIGEALAAQIHEVPQRFLATPLLVALLYRTYGFNGSISTRISSFYDELYNALYKGHDLSKSGFSREKDSGLEAEDFRRLLRAFSFIAIARQKDSFGSESNVIGLIQEAEQLVPKHPNSATAFFHDLLVAVPLLLRDGTEIRFIHKTIAEYFAAEYLVGSDQLVQRILKGPLKDAFQASIIFLTDVDPALFRRIVAAPIATAILNHFPAEGNALWRTVTFVLRGWISIWPLEEIKDANLGPGHIELPRAPEHHLEELYLYGRCSGQPVILALCYSKMSYLHSPAWQFLSEPSPYTREKHQSGIDFENLNQVLQPCRWHRLTDSAIHEIRDIQPLQKTFVMLLGQAFHVSESSERDPEKIAVISDIRAYELLRAVKEEQRASTWLQLMLQGHF